MGNKKIIFHNGFAGIVEYAGTHVQTRARQALSEDVAHIMSCNYNLEKTVVTL